MDRTGTSATEHRATVWSAGPGPVQLLLPAAAGERRESAADAAHRRTLFGVPVLRQPPFRGGAFCGMGAALQSQAPAAAHAVDGDRSHVPQAQFKPSGAGSRDLSLSAARGGHQPAQSGMEQRYYLCAAAPRLPLSDCGHGLVQPLCADLGAIEHAGWLVLPLGARSGPVQGPAGDLQLRPGIAVYGTGIPANLEAAGHPYQHGWARPRPGQCLHRAAVALGEVRTDLRRRLRRWRGDRLRVAPLLRSLQSTASSPSAGLPNACSRVRANRVNLFYRRSEPSVFGYPRFTGLCWKTCLSSTDQGAENCPNNGVHFTLKAVCAGSTCSYWKISSLERPFSRNHCSFYHSGLAQPALLDFAASAR